MRKPGKAIGIGCGISVVIGIVACFAFGFFFRRTLNESLKPVTDISRYQEIRATYWPSNMVSHFPVRLPSTASFHFHPAFLQGGAAIQARVPTSSAECASLLSSYSEHALAVYQGGDVNDHQNASNGIPTTFFYTGGTTDQKFPRDFSVLVLSAEDHDGGFAWNHGDSSGVAISTQRQEVVFWAESW